MSIKQEKAALRKSIKEILGELETSKINEQSNAVTAKALELPEYQCAKSISIFLSMPGREISTIDIVKDALQQGKRVFIPYIHASAENKKSKVMDMLRLKDESDLANLKPDNWGIPSFSADDVENRENALGGRGTFNSTCNSASSFDLDLVFMPGMAFDRKNNRLGHGKGFYDRYLSQMCDASIPQEHQKRLPRLVGLALREQLLPPGNSIPVTDDDWKIDQLVVAD